MAHLHNNIISSSADFQTDLTSTAQTGSFLDNRAVVKMRIAVQNFFFGIVFQKFTFHQKRQTSRIQWLLILKQPVNRHFLLYRLWGIRITQHTRI